MGTEEAADPGVELLPDSSAQHPLHMENEVDETAGEQTWRVAPPLIHHHPAIARARQPTACIAG